MEKEAKEASADEALAREAKLADARAAAMAKKGGNFRVDFRVHFRVDFRVQLRTQKFGVCPDINVRRNVYQDMSTLINGNQFFAQSHGNGNVPFGNYNIIHYF